MEAKPEFSDRLVEEIETGILMALVPGQKRKVAGSHTDKVENKNQQG